MIRHVGLREYSALECAIVSAGIETFWNGQFEKWDSINAAAIDIQKSISNASPETIVDSTLRWFSKKISQSITDDKSVLCHLYKPTTLQLVHGKVINTQQIREQLMSVAMVHGRHTTPSMLVTALARHLRDISKSQFHSEINRYKESVFEQDAFFGKSDESDVSCTADLCLAQSTKLSLM